MGIVLLQFVVITACLLPVKSIDWADPGAQVDKVKAVLRDQADKLRAAVIDEVLGADIRLMVKDPVKPADTHPLLPSAQIDVNHAISIFETGWMDFYTWVSDLDTEYKPVVKAHRLFYSKHYNSSLDTLLILHDRCGNARDHSVLKLVEALKLRNFDVHYNIMLMDFEKFMCHKMSPDAGLFKLGLHPQMKLLATKIGDFIHRGIKRKQLNPEKMNIVGLGTSAHLAVMVAKQIRKLSGQKINSILGLDPPVLLRERMEENDHTSYINTYHTFKLVPGTGPATGHATADIVFGGAKRGPQCKKALTSSCFKGFGVQLFVATLLFPKLFPGRWCPDYHKFSEHFCDGNDFTYVSFPPNKSASGIYQMEINYDFPFGKGLDGIFEKDEAEDDTIGGSGEMAKLSVQEYLHRLEMEVSRIRGEMMACIHGVMTPTAVMRCVMAAQPSVRRLEKHHLIRKLDCEPFPKSPTGKKCSYETRTHNTFELPF